MQKAKAKSCDNINVLNSKCCEMCHLELNTSYIHCDMCRNYFHVDCFNTHRCITSKRLQHSSSIRVFDTNLFLNPDFSLSSRSDYIRK